MENLVRELDDLTISGVAANNAIQWDKCAESLRRAFVPEKLIGNERPCEEKDFRDYRTTVNKNLQNVLTFLKLLRRNRDEGMTIDHNDASIGNFGVRIVLLIGEHSEKSVWNNAECVAIAKEISFNLCDLFGCENLSQLLSGADDKFSKALFILRPKLLRETWKTFPAAVLCYKWLLHQVDKPILSKHIGIVLTTALIIYDDFVPENRIIGLECIDQILLHSYLRKELMENGYADVIYDALERLTHQREVRYILPLYVCITRLLATMEWSDNSTHSFEWTKRDYIIATLLDNMEHEVNSELRHAYMMSLPQLLTRVGAAKWCERLTRVLAEYCSNQTDLKTLKVTLQASAAVLSMFQLRVPAHSPVLYMAFLKLHFDLTETPVFDKEITQTLENCISLLYKLTPTVGATIMRDDRMRSVIKNSVLLGCFGDTKYCN